MKKRKAASGRAGGKVERSRKRGAKPDAATRVSGKRKKPVKKAAPAKKRGVSKTGAFLAAFRATASVTKAAAAAKIERCLHYRWLKEDRQYAAEFERAKDEAAQTLEDEAVRRAVEGTQRPVFYRGKACGVIREYSDTLLQFLLKGFRPEKYRERATIEHSGPDGGPIPIEDSRLTTLTDEELNALLGLAQKLTNADSVEG